MRDTASAASTPPARMLRERVVPYLPSPVIKHLLSNQELSRPSAELQVGTILFADICGFTALTERLDEQGKAGVEALVSTMNRYYAVMLRLVDQFGGMLIKFGGDSLLVLFSETDHANRAAGCAIAMQQCMRHHFQGGKASTGLPEVHMTIGLHSGLFVSVYLGLPGERLEYILTGPEAGRALRVRQAGAPDEIVLSPSTDAQLARCFQVRRGAAWSKLCVPPHPVEFPVRTPHAPLQRLPPHQEAQLAYFLPESLRSRISAALPQRWLEGEHRHITALFIEIAGPSVTLQRALERSSAPNRAYSRALEALHTYLLHVDRAAHRYGGCLIRCDTTTCGERFLLLFGAPTMQEGNAGRAALCALEILRDPRWRGKIKQRCGIATGSAFCGDVGTAARREYTVMGNAINLAARLASQAKPQEILLDEATWQQIQGACQAQYLGKLTLRGRREPIAAHRLMGYSSFPAAMEARFPTRFVGRCHELAYLQEAGQRARAGYEQVIVIQGPAGIGKTRLVREFAEQWMCQRGRVVWGTCHHYPPIPLQPWQAILAGLQGGSASAPLLLQAPNLQAPDTADEPLKSLITVAQQAPLLVVLDNMQWSDEAALQLALACAARLSQQPVLLALLFREPPGSETSWASLKKLPGMTLSELSFKDSLQLAEHTLGVRSLGSLLHQTLLRQAGGNPLFVEEMLRAFQQAGLLLVDHYEGVAELQHSDPMPIPDSLEALVLSRIDRLSPVGRELIKAAAAIRPIVHRPALQAILPRPLRDEAIMQAGLRELCSAQLMVPDWRRPESHYHFVHELLREVVYDSLSTRRRLHIQWQLQNDMPSAVSAGHAARPSAA